MSELYLAHHGVQGMKWGVRRYQNYDGTYTKAGMARFNSSMSEYEKKKSAYDDIKESGTKGFELKKAKADVKAAKKKLNKDYKYLKLDNKADKGHIRYQEGQRINERRAVNMALSGIGGLTLTAASEMQLWRVGNQKVNYALMGTGAAIGTAGFVKSMVDMKGNKELQAYYGHTNKH